MKRLITLVLVFLSLSCLARGKGKEIKLLYWNIQNGMWHDQGNNYDGFVEYVKSLDPDICVWAEAESRYITDTGVKMKIPEEQYLPWNWDVLAARYGHKYTLIAGKRDTFPQVTGVDVTLTKLNPPMGADCAGASVELHLINDKTKV